MVESTVLTRTRKLVSDTLSDRLRYMSAPLSYSSGVLPKQTAAQRCLTLGDEMLRQCPGNNTLASASMLVVPFGNGWIGREQIIPSLVDTVNQLMMLEYMDTGGISYRPISSISRNTDEQIISIVNRVCDYLEWGIQLLAADLYCAWGTGGTPNERVKYFWDISSSKWVTHTRFLDEIAHILENRAISGKEELLDRYIQARYLYEFYSQCNTYWRIGEMNSVGTLYSPVLVTMAIRLEALDELDGLGESAKRYRTWWEEIYHDPTYQPWLEPLDPPSFLGDIPQSPDDPID